MLILLRNRERVLESGRDQEITVSGMSFFGIKLDSLRGSIVIKRRMRIAKMNQRILSTFTVY